MISISTPPCGDSGIGDGAVTLPIQLPRELSNALQAGPANSLLKLAGIRYLMNSTVWSGLMFNLSVGVHDRLVESGLDVVAGISSPSPWQNWFFIVLVSNMIKHYKQGIQYHWIQEHDVCTSLCRLGDGVDKGVTLEGSLGALVRRAAYLYRQPTNEHRMEVGSNWLQKAISQTSQAIAGKRKA